ncbi:hypothetical protein NL676_030536 [Syzygium grande]|nr:hypothetical protein NL676_030536 [Syzygium grande]
MVPRIVSKSVTVIKTSISVSIIAAATAPITMVTEGIFAPIATIAGFFAPIEVAAAGISTPIAVAVVYLVGRRSGVGCSGGNIWLHQTLRSHSLGSHNGGLCLVNYSRGGSSGGNMRLHQTLRNRSLGGHSEGLRLVGRSRSGSSGGNMRLHQILLSRSLGGHSWGLRLVGRSRGLGSHSGVAGTVATCGSTQFCGAVRFSRSVAGVATTRRIASFATSKKADASSGIGCSPLGLCMGKKNSKLESE